MFRRVDDVFFNVDDMDPAVAFYRDTLGLAVKYHAADWTELHGGNVTIALRRFGPGPGGRPELGVGAGAPLVFEVDDLERRGVRFFGGVSEHGSMKLAAWEDLNGNVLQVYEHIW